MSLSDIVNVTITALTTAPSRVGFGTPLVMAYHTVFPERARIYTSVAAMLTDGFSADSPAVRAVQSLFSQNPRPDKVVVGRETGTEKQLIKLTPVSTNLKATYAYTVYVNGLEATFTTDASPTVAEITAGLKSAIDALSEPVTTTDNSTDLEIEATTVADAFSFYAKERQILHVENLTPDGTVTPIAEDIAAVQEENDDWYGLVLTNHGKAVILAAAAYIETLVKIFAASSGDDGIYDSAVTTDIASSLAAAGYARTFLLYHPKDLVQYPEAGWLGLALPKDPGSMTWKFKTIAGSDSVSLTETEITNIRAKKCNLYHVVAGIAITEEGITSAGEFIDITQSVDFMRARLQENIFARLANADKIPYTDPGVAIVEAEVRAVLKLCINQGILAAVPEPTVSVPLVADVSTIDKAARTLPDVKFEGTLAGAIHKVIVTGTVSV